jgi:hypothetical protein
MLEGIKGRMRLQQRKTEKPSRLNEVQRLMKVASACNLRFLEDNEFTLER